MSLLIPTKSFAHVIFGEVVPQDDNIQFVSSEMVVDTTYFQFDYATASAEVYTLSDKKVEYIRCWENVSIGTFDLIGCLIEDFNDFFGVRQDEEDTYEFEEGSSDVVSTQTAYVYNGFGLQLWTENAVVVTVIAGDAYN